MIRIFTVAGRAIRVLVVSAVLVAVEVGIPVMLGRFAGWPLPREIPTLPVLQRVLLSPIPDDVLLKVLACPLWLLWAAFTAALLVEITATIRGVEIHVPLLGPFQNVAAGLVGLLAIAVLPIDLRAAAVPAPHLMPVAATAVQETKSATPIRSDRLTVGGRPDRVHVVKSGDSLWKIAKHKLGSARQWRKIWKLNAHRSQRDGQIFADPDLIQPGWRLRLPVAFWHRPAVSQVEPVTSAPKARPTASPEQTVQPSERVQQDVADTSVIISIDVPSGGAVALSAAAGLCAAYALSRFQRRRRRIPPPASEGVTIRPEPEPAPVVRAARRGYLQTFRDRGEEVPSDADLIRAASAIDVPDSIVIGSREDGSVATIPLAGLSLGLTGPGARDVVRALVLDLLQRAGNFRLEVLAGMADAAELTGMDHDELHALASAVPGLTILETPDAALERFEQTGFTRRRVLIERDACDVDELRGRDPGELLPTVIFVATVEGDMLARLGASSLSGTGCGIGTLVLGDWPAGTTCKVGADHSVSTADGPLAGRLAGASFVHLAGPDLADALRQCGDAQPVDKVHDDTASPSETGSTWEHPPPVWVQVLGKPAVRVKGQDRPLRIRGLKLSLLAYLALHEDGATKEAIGEALWPGKLLGHEFHSLLRHLRDALEAATGLTGELFIQAMDDETYRIDPSRIGFDLWAFQTAVKEVRAAREPSTRLVALARAAALCGGEFGTGISDDWVFEERYPLTLAQVDVLTQLAELCEQDEPEQALEALEQARHLDPDAEETWCRTIRLQQRLGRLDQARHTGQLLRAHLRSLEVEPMPDTDELLASLADRSTSRRTPR
ncbi:BTAD domain-containing putative transcriptional regulator [Streptosporangium soli]|nr:LysM peptidoglycan-binding domain-containing protein [Streptosporangium sp. KLBMP 9127]